MTENDRDAFAALLADVHKYYRQPISDFLMDVWWEGCQPFTLQQVSRACSRHARDPDRGRFCPGIADIERILSGTPSERALVAWGKVHEAMARVGAYQDVVFYEGVIHAVIQDMGGWPKLARSETADLSYTQHRFVELHKALSVRGFDGYPRVLMGDRDKDDDYARRGLPPPTPVLVGDPKECARVWEGGGDARVMITHVKSSAALAALAASAIRPALPASFEDPGVVEEEPAR